MARIEVLLSDEFDELLRQRADAEQSTISECVRSLIERVLTGFDEHAESEDPEALRSAFEEFAWNYPATRQELFEDDPDLRLDKPYEPSEASEEPLASSMSTEQHAFTGHLADRHVYAMAVRVPGDAKPDSDVVTMARVLEPRGLSSAKIEMLSKYIVHMYLAGDEPLDGPLIVYPRAQPTHRPHSATT